MNKIILVEDVEEFANNFTTEAKSKGIDVSHKKSFKGLKELLPKYHTKFGAVVLDIKCLLEDESPKEDAAFIGAAMKFLDQSVPSFPRFILTGDENEFGKFKSFFRDEKIFLKNPDDVGRLFETLKECLAKSEILLLRRLYPDIFDCYDRSLLPQNSETQIISILQKGLSEKEFVNFKGIFAEIRAFQEIVLKTINTRRKDAVPDSMIRPNGMLKFNDLMHHLSGYPDSGLRPTRTVFQNKAIYNMNDSLYWICGEYIHDDPNRNYSVSDYTLKSAVHNLLELIIWSKGLV